MKKEIFDAVINALLDNSRPFPPTYLHRLSGISTIELNQLKAVWGEISDARRISLIEDLEDLSESDPLLNFDDIARFCLNDQDPRIRSAGLRLLWEYEGKDLIQVLINILRTDTSELVRATAASNLGKFVFLGDMGEIKEVVFKDIIENLLLILNSTEKPIVQRRALEALAYHDREDINNYLLEAYNSGSSEWVSSALFGMGRSANDRWNKLVLGKINATDRENRLEAIKAAGELELKSARRPLIEALNEEDDEEFRYAIMWSLSKIGGEGVLEALNLQMENADNEDEEFIESALDNLEFTESLTLPDLFEAEEFEEEDFYKIVDLDEETNNDDTNEDKRLISPSPE